MSLPRPQGQRHRRRGRQGAGGRAARLQHHQPQPHVRTRASPIPLTGGVAVSLSRPQAQRHRRRGRQGAGGRAARLDHYQPLPHVRARASFPPNRRSRGEPLSSAGATASASRAPRRLRPRCPARASPTSASCARARVPFPLTGGVAVSLSSAGTPVSATRARRRSRRFPAFPGTWAYAQRPPRRFRANRLNRAP